MLNYSNAYLLYDYLSSITVIKIIASRFNLIALIFQTFSGPPRGRACFVYPECTLRTVHVYLQYIAMYTQPPQAFIPSSTTESSYEAKKLPLIFWYCGFLGKKSLLHTNDLLYFDVALITTYSI